MLSLLVSLLVILLIGFAIYLERRLARLEVLVADFSDAHLATQQGSTPPDWPAGEQAATYDDNLSRAEVEPEPQPELEPRPEPTVLYAEMQPTEPEAVDDRTIPLEGPQGRFAFNVEELFGRRLPIWAGGITLAVAGFFIVKLSIEAGLLSPPVRVIGGMIFGIALIAAAEMALRYHERVGDARVRQALSGAGLATLYASILVAANLYHLVPPVIAMVGIAGVTGAAMLLSIRFGAASALLGLAGGLSAPALIGSAEPNVPLLALYLAFAVGGLAVLSRNHRWAWLGISALIGGFGWGALLLLGGALDLSSTVALGLYLLLLGVGLPMIGFAGDRSDRLQLFAGIAAAAQMAALVASGGFDLLNWGLFGAIAAATVWLATREPTLQRLPAVALAIALLLAGAWPDPAWPSFALVLTGIALIHGPMPVRRLWSDRGDLLDAGQVAAIGLCGWLVSMLHFHRPEGANDTPLGQLALGLALTTGLIAAAGWRFPDRSGDARFVIVVSSAAFLLAAASTLLLPAWISGIAIAAAGLVLLHVGQQADDHRFEPIAWIFAAAGFVACFTPDGAFHNARAIDTARFALIALVAGAFAWQGRYSWARAIAQFLGALFVYFTLALWLDDRLEPAVAALIMIAAAYAGRFLTGERLVPAMVAAASIIARWAIGPLYDWTDGATASLIGDPLLVGAVPGVEAALTQLLLPALLAALALWLAKPRLRRWERASGITLAAILGTVGTHSLYKHVFSIVDANAFVALGLAERTAWEGLLFAVAAAVRMNRRQVALGLAAAGLAHFTLYSLLLHNPLWSAQWVGSLPVANLLLPAYGMPLAALVVIGRTPALQDHLARRALAVAQMLLIALLAFSELRQLFHGTLLVDHGLSQAEDIARSIVAIALAVGFLLWGIRREERDWRVASLVLMLAAVGKVFLFDASGLEGLIRIASFIALGFSLIGIGWLYSRFLPAREAQLANAGSSR
jgi:uncharacterized membrane protein